MGTYYYLIRDCGRVVYELGKMYDWQEVFGDTLFTIDNIDLLAISLYVYSGWDTDELAKYCERVAFDIADWAEGKSFRFASEHDGELERIDMEDYDSGISQRRIYMTGSRYTHPVDGMEELAARRKQSQSFRDGSEREVT